MVCLCPCSHIPGSGFGLAFWKIYVIYGLICFDSNHCSAFYLINVLFLILIILSICSIQLSYFMGVIITVQPLKGLMSSLDIHKLFFARMLSHRDEDVQFRFKALGLLVLKSMKRSWSWFPRSNIAALIHQRDPGAGKGTPAAAKSNLLYFNMFL